MEFGDRYLKVVFKNPVSAADRTSALNQGTTVPFSQVFIPKTDQKAIMYIRLGFRISETLSLGAKSLSLAENPWVLTKNFKVLK